MKSNISIKSIFSLAILIFTTINVSAIPLTKLNYHSVEYNEDFYETIVSLDSIFFTAYNNCYLEKQSERLSEDLEFYHAQRGLSTSNEEILIALKNNICGKVRQELVKGSIEVHEIQDFDAIQMGMNKLYNNEEPNEISKASKFVTIWKLNDKDWKISRVISLH